MAGYLEGAVSVVRMDTRDPAIYLFKVIRSDRSSLSVVWEKRDQFSGEDAPPVRLTVVIPWAAARTEGLFRDEKRVRAVEGSVIVEVTDTPVFILPGSDCSNH